MGLISLPWYLSLLYFLTDGSYPKDATESISRRIRYRANLLMINEEGVLVEKKSGRELLHEGNALQRIQDIHNEGHQGINNTLDKVTKYYLVHEGRKLVTSVVKGCETCQFRARIKNVRVNPGVIFKTTKDPFVLVGVDAIGPLQPTTKGNRYILTGIDYLTRWPVALAVPDIDEVTTGEFLFSIVKDWGVPRYILSDRGANFISTYVHEFLKQLGCRNIMTTSYRAQSNGMCERLNYSLVSVLAKVARDEENISEWDKYVDTALMVIRTSKNSGTGYTPSYMMFGYEMRTPAVWVAPRVDFVIGEEEEEVRDRVLLVEEKLAKVREIARLRSDERKKKAKARYDGRVVFRKKFEIGDQVLLKDVVPKTKFSDKWIGPFTVFKVNQNGTYLLTGKNSLRLKHAVNGDLLKSFNNEVEHMVPQVGVSEANEQFRSWLNSRVNTFNFIDTLF
jgi:hypothetical protein